MWRPSAHEAVGEALLDEAGRSRLGWLVVGACCYGCGWTAMVCRAAAPYHGDRFSLNTVFVPIPGRRDNERGVDAAHVHKVGLDGKRG